MKIEQEFRLNRELEDVWSFFQDIPAVAQCLPGAEYLGEKEDGSHLGKMSMKVGPFQAAFEGAAKVDYDQAANAISMEGKGVDKKGASRGKMKMDCQLSEHDGSTKVAIAADVQLSGSIAQFGRTGIIEEIASVLISDFVSNVEAEMPSRDVRESDDTPLNANPESKTVSSAPLSGGRLVWLALKGWLRSLFGGRKA